MVAQNRQTKPWTLRGPSALLCYLKAAVGSLRKGRVFSWLQSAMSQLDAIKSPTLALQVKLGLLFKNKRKKKLLQVGQVPMS